jgi:hypothetical protein
VLILNGLCEGDGSSCAASQRTSLMEVKIVDDVYAQKNLTAQPSVHGALQQAQSADCVKVAR